MSIDWYRPDPLKVGQRAPDFELESTAGRLRLCEEAYKGPIILAFYMGDFGTTCSWVLSKFRDKWPEIKEMSCNIWAISCNDISSHRRYDSRMNFPFPLLADVGSKVIETYGCKIENHDIYAGMAGRAVYVVDEDCNIAYAWAAEDDPAQTPDYAGLMSFLESYSYNR